MGFARWLFSDGIRFIFLPFSLYLLGWEFNISLAWVKVAVSVLNLAILAALVVWLKHQWSKSPQRDRFFWILLFLFFLIPGAYLEFPSDPWEHLRRILSWNHSADISSNPYRFKFAYFWMWTLISWIPLEMLMESMSVLNAVWQTLLCYQVYRFVGELGFRYCWQRAQVLAFVAFFGTNIFSLRYYALSSTPLAYMAYLRGLSGILSRPAKGWIEIAFLLILIGFNHLQELCFFLGAAALVLLGRWIATLGPSARKRVISTGLAILVSGVAWGMYSRAFHPDRYVLPGPPSISRFGSFRLWQGVAIECLGVSGILGLLAALVQVKRRPLLAGLTLLPVVTLLFPPTAYFILGKISHSYDYYRVFYAMPACFALLALVQDLSDRFGRRMTWFLGAILLGIAVIPTFPIRGRLYFQWHQPSPLRSLGHIEETATWLSKNRRYPKGCKILTDDSTAFALSAILGYPTVSDRRRPTYLLKNIDSEEAIRSLLVHTPLCGVLIADSSRLASTGESWAAKASGHWDSDLGNTARLTHPRANFWAEAVLQKKLGWSAEAVPPLFLLYEPPEILVNSRRP